jgi:hypothetical protein
MLGQKGLVEEGLSKMGLSNVTAAGPVRLSIDGSDVDFAPSAEDLIVLQFPHVHRLARICSTRCLLVPTRDHLGGR